MHILLVGLMLLALVPSLALPASRPSAALDARGPAGKRDSSAKFTGCPAGQRNARKDECSAAVKEVANALSKSMSTAVRGRAGSKLLTGLPHYCNTFYWR